MRTFISIILVVISISCNSNKESLTQKELLAVHDSVQVMAESISKNVSDQGPVAWLRCFENTPEFFMAFDGKLTFPNYDSASHFINNTLVKIVTKIELRWSNIRIDPLTLNLASFAATFHEDITGSTGKTVPEDGYLTAIAHKTTKGWQLRNAHWSGSLAE